MVLWTSRSRHTLAIWALVILALTTRPRNMLAEATAIAYDEDCAPMLASSPPGSWVGNKYVITLPHVTDSVVLAAEMNTSCERKIGEGKVNHALSSTNPNAKVEATSSVMKDYYYNYHLCNGSNNCNTIGQCYQHPDADGCSQATLAQAQGIAKANLFKAPGNQEVWWEMKGITSHRPTDHKSFTFGDSIMDHDKINQLDDACHRNQTIEINLGSMKPIDSAECLLPGSHSSTETTTHTDSDVIAKLTRVPEYFHIEDIQDSSRNSVAWKYKDATDGNNDLEVGMLHHQLKNIVQLKNTVHGQYVHLSFGCCGNRNMTNLAQCPLDLKSAIQWEGSSIRQLMINEDNGEIMKTLTGTPEGGYHWHVDAKDNIKDAVEYFTDGASKEIINPYIANPASPEHMHKARVSVDATVTLNFHKAAVSFAPIKQEYMVISAPIEISWPRMEGNFPVDDTEIPVDESPEDESPEDDKMGNGNNTPTDDNVMNHEPRSSGGTTTVIVLLILGLVGVLVVKSDSFKNWRNRGHNFENFKADFDNGDSVELGNTSRGRAEGGP